MSEKLYTFIGDEKREFTESEYAQHETDLAEEKKAKAAKTKAEKALADKRQTILDRLGLTTDEFQTLTG